MIDKKLCTKCNYELAITQFQIRDSKGTRRGVCKNCRNSFQKNKEYTKKRLQSEKGKVYKKEANRKRLESERGKNYMKRLLQSEEGKAYKKEANRKRLESERGKNYMKRLLQSEEGKAYKKEANRKRLESEKGKDYVNSDKMKKYRYEYTKRRLQSEAGREYLKKYRSNPAVNFQQRCMVRLHIAKKKYGNRWDRKNISSHYFRELMFKQNFRCAITHELLIKDGGRSYEIDHIIPLFLGGSHSKDNLQLLSLSAHKRKSLAELQMYHDFGRIHIKKIREQTYADMLF